MIGIISKCVTNLALTGPNILEYHENVLHTQEYYSIRFGRNMAQKREYIAWKAQTWSFYGWTIAPKLSP